MISIDSKKVLLRDYGIANPRVYVAGLTPAQIESHDYYTIEETNEAIENAIEGIGISGYVTTEQFEEGMATKQDQITADSQLDFELLSGVPNFATEEYVSAAISGKANKSEIPLSTSQLINDSDFATSGYVDASVSGKADKTELDNYQPLITNDAKLSYDLLSGTPSIPTKTSELTNDSDFATSGYVDAGLLTKQDQITEQNKLPYSLISGTPEIPNPAWGNLTGQLSAQTDLWNELSGKASQTDLNTLSGELDDINAVLIEIIGE